MPLTGRPDSDAETLERKLRKAALRREPTALSVATKSPLSPRDLDFLVELDRRHSVTVDVAIPTADSDGARPLLKTVSRLAAEGIATRVVCSPVAQGNQEGEETLRSLFAAAREAGAWDVAAETSPKRFRFTRLRKDRDRDALATFRRLRLEYGFPRVVPGRG
jgi:DNA repair photolyase